LYFPLSQSLHVPGPAVALNVPATQSLHSDCPEASAYLPAVQAVQAAPLAELLPASQLVQDVAVSVPALYVSVPQFSHVVPLLFRPGPHSFTHRSPLGPFQPDTQLQSVAASLPATLLLLSGQPVQDVAMSVPALNVPESQFSHVVPLPFRPGPHSFKH